jgi:hypothetical protein
MPIVKHVTTATGRSYKLKFKKVVFNNGQFHTVVKLYDRGKLGLWQQVDEQTFYNMGYKDAAIVTVKRYEAELKKEKQATQKLDTHLVELEVWDGHID